MTSDAVLDENGDTVPNVEPLMSHEENLGCGLNFTKFAESHYGDWKCMLEKADDSENYGSFRINQPGNWPTDIRLPTDLNVSQCFQPQHFVVSISIAILSKSKASKY